MDKVAEQHERPWLLPASPVIWALHFMLCYVTAALWCGRFGGPYGAYPSVRTAIAIYTVLALAAIAAIGYVGYRRHSYGAAALPHDDDTPEDRYRFVGFTTLLLSGLSAVAVVYAALAAVIIEGCQ